MQSIVLVVSWDDPIGGTSVIGPFETEEGARITGLRIEQDPLVPEDVTWEVTTIHKPDGKENLWFQNA